MNFPRLAALVISLGLASGSASAADRVTLTSHDGTIVLTGDLLSYDGEFIRIETVYGTLTIAGSGVVCEGAACPIPDFYMAELMISGSALTGTDLMPRLLEAFAARKGLTFVRQDEDETHFLYVLTDPASLNPVARIRFRITTTTEGFADLVSEQADIAMAFREVSDSENARSIEANLGDLRRDQRSQIVALDAIAPLVAEENPVKAISVPDLGRVLSGEIRNWADLGGPDAEIAVHLPGSEHGLSARFITVADQEGAVPWITRHGGVADVARAVAGDNRALGLGTTSRIGDARALSLLGSCGHFVAAQTGAIKSEDYPLSAPHYLYTPARRLPAIARDLLDFLASGTAQDVVRAAGFVDQGLEYRPLAEQGDRLSRAILATGREVGAPDLRRMVAALQNGARVSLTFRFEDGSADLDAPSRANVTVLAKHIVDGRFGGGKLLFAGFSDGQGSAGSNLELSRRRAETVRDAVIAAIGADADIRTELVADGFGEVMPMGCDEDDWGRRINRRVEVWLHQR
jgi:phosphate transport system substrate-binding protein